MERGQPSSEDNSKGREQPSHEEAEITENCTSTTPAIGPILIDSIYIDLGVLIENKDNQHCSNREYVSDVDNIARHSQPIRRRRKAKKTRSLKEIYAATECISSHVNNAESGNNEDDGSRLNGSLAPTQEIPQQQPLATEDDADVEAVQVLLSLRDP